MTDTLFDDDDICPHCKQPMPKQPSVVPKANPIREALGHFGREFERVHQEKAPITPGADGKHMKALIAIYGVERVKELITAFFDSDDPFIKNSNYSVGVFRSQVGKIIAANHTKARPFGGTRNTAGNVAVAERFLQRRAR